MREEKSHGVAYYGVSLSTIFRLDRNMNLIISYYIDRVYYEAHYALRAQDCCISIVNLSSIHYQSIDNVDHLQLKHYTRRATNGQYRLCIR